MFGELMPSCYVNADSLQSSDLMALEESTEAVNGAANPESMLMLRSQSCMGYKSSSTCDTTKSHWKSWEEIIKNMHSQGKTKRDILNLLTRESCHPPSMGQLMSQMYIWNLGVNPESTSACENVSATKGFDEVARPCNESEASPANATQSCLIDLTGSPEPLDAFIASRSNSSGTLSSASLQARIPALSDEGRGIRAPSSARNIHRYGTLEPCEPDVPFSVYSIDAENAYPSPVSPGNAHRIRASYMRASGKMHRSEQDQMSPANTVNTRGSTSPCQKRPETVKYGPLRVEDIFAENEDDDQGDLVVSTESHDEACGIHRQEIAESATSDHFWIRSHSLGSGQLSPATTGPDHRSRIQNSIWSCHSCRWANCLATANECIACGHTRCVSCRLRWIDTDSLNLLKSYSRALTRQAGKLLVQVKQSDHPKNAQSDSDHDSIYDQIDVQPGSTSTVGHSQRPVSSDRGFPSDYEQIRRIQSDEEHVRPANSYLHPFCQQTEDNAEPTTVNDVVDVSVDKHDRISPESAHQAENQSPVPLDSSPTQSTSPRSADEQQNSGGDTQYTPQSDGEISFMGMSSPDPPEAGDVYRLMMPEALDDCIRHVLNEYYNRNRTGNSPGGIRYRTSEPSPTESQRSLQPTTSNASPSTAVSSPKRKRGPSDDDSRDDAGEGSKRAKPGPQSPTEPKIRRLFACPYAKHDHVRYSEQNTAVSECLYRGCSSVYASDISRLKQHLYRNHTRPRFFCDVCYERFDCDKDRAAHARARSCNSQQCPFEEKMDTDQERIIKEKFCRETPIESWYRIYVTLFGNPTPDSPFSDGPWQQDVEDLVDFFTSRSVDLWHEIISPRLNEIVVSLDSQQQMLLDVLQEETLRELLHRLGREYRTRALLSVRQPTVSPLASIVTLATNGTSASPATLTMTGVERGSTQTSNRSTGYIAQTGHNPNFLVDTTNAQPGQGDESNFIRHGQPSALPEANATAMFSDAQSLFPGFDDNLTINPGDLHWRESLEYQAQGQRSAYPDDQAGYFNNVGGRMRG